MLAVRGATVAAGSLCARRLLLHLKRLRCKNVLSVCCGRCVGVDRALK
jgi:hypothetical protein